MTGRLDVPGDDPAVQLNEYVLGQKPAAAAAAIQTQAEESMSIPVSGNARVVVLDADASVLVLAEVLGLPGACFFMAVGSKVLHGDSSLEEAGVNANFCGPRQARILGGMQLAGVAGGDFGQWTCTNPQCAGQRGHDASGVKARTQAGLPPLRCCGREQNHRGRLAPVATRIPPTTSKKASARLLLRPRQIFLLLSHSPRCRRWNC